MIQPTKVPPSEDAKAYAATAVDACFDPAQGILDWNTAKAMLAIAWQSGYQTAIEPCYCKDDRICWKHRHAPR